MLWHSFQQVRNDQIWKHHRIQPIKNKKAWCCFCVCWLFDSSDDAPPTFLWWQTFLLSKKRSIFQNSKINGSSSRILSVANESEFCNYLRLHLFETKATRCIFACESINNRSPKNDGELDGYILKYLLGFLRFLQWIAARRSPILALISWDNNYLGIFFSRTRWLWALIKPSRCTAR